MAFLKGSNKSLRIYKDSLKRKKQPKDKGDGDVGKTDKNSLGATSEDKTPRPGKPITKVLSIR